MITQVLKEKAADAQSVFHRTTRILMKRSLAAGTIMQSARRHEE